MLLIAGVCFYWWCQASSGLLLFLACLMEISVVWSPDSFLNERRKKNNLLFCYFWLIWYFSCRESRLTYLSLIPLDLGFRWVLIILIIIFLPYIFGFYYKHYFEVCLVFLHTVTFPLLCHNSCVFSYLWTCRLFLFFFFFLYFLTWEEFLSLSSLHT